jgi:tRNA 2-thiocytidine biosynthesis protein TtcA
VPGWSEVIGRKLGRAAADSDPVCSVTAAPVAAVVPVVGKIPRSITSATTQGLKEFSMVRPHDRVLVGLSGGKDSLTLLHVLRNVKRRCGFPFDLAAATVDPMTPEYNPESLGEYCRSLGVEHFMLKEPIMQIAKTKMKNESICAFCARMKRGLLYNCMRTNGYNVLALGQHMDDIVESFMMSVWRNGALRTMKAHYICDEGDLRIIRPLVYVRERDTEKFAKDAKLPIVADNCPACFKEPKERRRIKLMLSAEEYENPGVFGSISRAIKPLLLDATASADDTLAEIALTSCGASGVCHWQEPRKASETSKL